MARLNKSMKLHLCRLLAEGRSFVEIIELFRKSYTDKRGNPFALWAGQVVWYSRHPKWQPVIEAFRRDWNTAISDIPVSNLRRQMEMLQEIADRGLEWKLAGRSTVYLENPLFDPSKPLTRFNPMYIERKIPRYRCHPEWTIRAVELAAELKQGKKQGKK